MTTTARVRVASKLLRWAREHSSATLSEAATRCGRTDAELRTWEDRDSEVPLAALRELANLYAVPLSLFLLAEPPHLPPRPADLRTIAGVVSPAPSMDLAKALNRAAALQVLAQELLEGTEASTFIAGQAEQGDAETLASAQREAVGVGIAQQRKWPDERQALRAWRSVIENRGIFVLQFPMRKAEVRAFSLSHQPPFIVLNQSDFVRARIFSLVHEYAHVLLGTGAICIPGSGRLAMERAAAVEVFCNKFAGAFLVPADALRAEPATARISNASTLPDDQTLDALARKFHVSWAVVWYRMWHLGLISRERFTKKWEDWDWYPTPRSGGGGMTTGERILTTYGLGLSKLVLAAAQRDLISPADVSQYLDFAPGRLGDVEAEVAARAAA